MPSPPPLRDLDYAALAEFRHRLRAFLAFSEDQARAAGLTPQQHQLLLAVRAAPSASTIGELAARLVLRHHSTVELVDRLVDKGLVARIRDPRDRRQARVELTLRGTAVVRDLARAHGDELRRAGPDLIDALVAVTGAARGRAPRTRRAVRR